MEIRRPMMAWFMRAASKLEKHEGDIFRGITADVELNFEVR